MEDTYKLNKLDFEEELPSEEHCDEMNRFFHHFWNFDDWDTVPEKRLQWFDAGKMTLADQRRWRLEVTRRKKIVKGTTDQALTALTSNFGLVQYSW